MSQTITKPTLRLVHNSTERESLEKALEAAVAFIVKGDPKELDHCLAYDAKLTPSANLNLASESIG